MKSWKVFQNVSEDQTMNLTRSDCFHLEAVNLTSVCAYGGGPMGEQLSALKKGLRFLSEGGMMRHGAWHTAAGPADTWAVLNSQQLQLSRPTKSLVSNFLFFGGRQQEKNVVQTANLSVR